MLKEIRKTNAGVEYWDTEAKKIIIGKEGLADEEVNEEVKTDNDNGDLNLDDMNSEQLLDFAKQNGIEVPGNMKKEDTIRNHIEEELNAASDSE